MILDVQVQKVVVTDAVICRDDQVIVADILRNDEGGNGL